MSHAEKQFHVRQIRTVSNMFARWLMTL